MDRDGDASCKPNFVDPLRAEIALNVPRETVGPSFSWHECAEHLQVNLQGQHRSCHAAARDAAKNGIEADELFKIGVALSSPSVTLEDVTQMRKRLADTIVIWDTGKRSDRHGTGKNLLPPCEMSNEHVTLANTVKNVAGARFSGSNAELAALDKILAEHAKIGEVLRQLCAVRMSCQAEATDNVLDCILRARSIDDDSTSAADAEERAAALLAAQNDLEFIRDWSLALSALFMAVYLTLPSILAARVLPDSSAKSLERETATLVSTGELQKHKQQSELRSGHSTASSASSSAKSSSAKSKGKHTAEEKRKHAEKMKKARTSSPGKSGAAKPKTPVSTRPPTSPASGGPRNQSAERSKQQRRNDKQRLKVKERKRRAAEGSDNDAGDTGDRDTGRGTPPGGGRGVSGNDKHGSGGKSPRAGGGGKRHKGQGRGSGN